MIRLYRAACEYLEALTDAIRNEAPAWENHTPIGFRSTK